MLLPPRPVRRALAPLLLAVEVGLLAVFAAGALLGALAAVVSRPRRLLRVCGFACGYLVMEIAALPLALWVWLRALPGLHSRDPRRRERARLDWVATHHRLLEVVLGKVLAWATRCVGFSVVVDGPLDPLDGDGPLLALARHGGPGDSFALVELLLSRGRHVRIVLKQVLQLDPALDILLNRLDACFLPSRHGAGGDLPKRLAELAERLEGRDTLLVFPEGGNWTPRRRRRAIRRLRGEHRREAARAATLMANVLPPRPAGVQAVLAARPDLPVVLLAHAGLDRLVQPAEVWKALPLTTAMTVRVWPTAPVPAARPDAEAAGVDPGGVKPGGVERAEPLVGAADGDDDERRLAWLTTEWATVDEWVDAYHTAHPEAPGRTWAQA
ncbi:MAG TPA: 1-acyl-sn-glycerol-3-phosphate acyltransferase [Acidimicrobiales bacterium]|nr:1-acyl-sn-glycerol-3-phosphate acyltransferase [Acidimicrobiales bacterium]